MEIEIAAILTVACKLLQLERILDRRIERAALDVVSPTLTLLEKVRRLGEYKRLTANLAVMEHRLRCALGDDADLIIYAAHGRYGLDYSAKHVRSALKTAKGVLKSLGIESGELNAYKDLPLYAAECKKLARLKRRRASALNVCYGAEFSYCRDGRTAQAL